MGKRMQQSEMDRAETIQALRAYLIPSSLFVACLLGAAATFLVTNGEPLGWGLYAAMLSIIVWAFYSFITFQNKLRAEGKFRGQAAVHEE